MRPIRSSPFPRWAPAAAAGRLLLSLLALALLGVAFVYSLKPVDPRTIKNQTARFDTALGGARRLDLRLPFQLARHLKLVSAPARASPVFAAQLIGSRPGTLSVRRRPSGMGTRLDLRRALGDLPTFIQIGASSVQSGVPDTLSLSVPEGVPLSLWLTHSADDATLDLRRLSLETLNFASTNGDLSATLPERGRPRLNLSTDTGRVELRVPPGPAHTSLALSSGSGDLRLSVPPSAQVQLDLRLGEQDPQNPDEVSLPGTFRFTALIGRGGQVRRYVQTGTPGGPRLHATLSLGSGALSVQTTPGETP